jgi:ferredoxin
MPNIIYYFSGTGNSLAVARSVAKKLGDTEVVSIITLRENSAIPAKYDKVGFVLPTCFTHASKIVTEIGETLQFSPTQKVFIIATCGGHDGFTLIDFTRLLQPKTKTKIQGFRLLMPPNHIVGFSPLPEFFQRMYFRHADKATSKIARIIRNGTPTKPKIEFNRRIVRRMSVSFNGRLGIPDVDSTVAEYFTTDACTHCGICEKLCKVGNIKVSEEQVTFGDNCQQCMACVQWCPDRAIAHPNIPKNRKRYHHPDIKLEDMLNEL